MTITLNHVRSPYLGAPVTLTLGTGIHGIIGPNGSGKTTLLRLIAGHHRPTAGTVATATTVLARAGSDACFAGTTVRDHLAVARIGHPALGEDLAAQVLAIAGISPTAVIRRLSVGHRQLIAVAVALAANAPVTLLDEPFNGLDVRTRSELRQVLIQEAARRENWTLLLTSHRSEDLAGLVTDVTALRNGGSTGPTELDQVRKDFPTLVGPAETVRSLTGEHPVVERAVLGPTLRLTLASALSPSEARRAEAEGVEITHPDDRTLIDLLSTDVLNRDPKGL